MSQGRLANASNSSVSMEDRILRDTILRLEEELVCQQAKYKKISDQLNCLIMLVKQ